MRADVSVIIPSYNRAHCIERALCSVFEQNSLPQQVIVVDDGSTDRTQALIRHKYPQVRLISQSNRGVSAARNAGIAAADTEFIAFLDSDDAWLPHKLQRQVAWMQDHPDCVFSHTEEIWIRNGVRVNPMNKHRKSGGLIYSHCLPLCVISPSSVIIRRVLLEQVGGFDETLPACEDYDLWLRICSRFPVAFLEEPLLLKYGGHADQLSRKYWGMDRYRITALIKMLDSGWLDAENTKLTVEMLRKKCRIFIKGARKHKNIEDIGKYEAILSSYDYEPAL
ncbi:MAG: glycosyltransferase family 2 protein [Gammaproteobacteria bacterium]|nr:glycosyltransferase family 2 protein [Gammaproteobacteria bacterium]MDH5801063.1 glycosyltransferase family 2 protein [Gammaproteobacteria bacterium]